MAPEFLVIGFQTVNAKLLLCCWDFQTCFINHVVSKRLVTTIIKPPFGIENCRDLEVQPSDANDIFLIIVATVRTKWCVKVAAGGTTELKNICQCRGRILQTLCLLLNN